MAGRQSQLSGGKSSRLAAALLASLAAAVALAATAPARPESGAAGPRLEGAWRLTGKIVSGQNLAGQKVGDSVKRSWSFAPRCPTGACDVTLKRERPDGGFATDQLKLEGTVYSGSELFVGSYTCNGVEYPQGEKGPIKIVVRVVKAKTIGGVLRATKIQATLSSSFAPVAAVRAKGCAAPVKAVTQFTGALVT